MSVKQETVIAGFPNCFNGVRYSVYLGLKEQLFSVYFFFTTIFDRLIPYHANSLSEFRLILSQIDAKDFMVNSPYCLLELIRHIFPNTKHQPVGTFACAENLFVRLALHMMVCVFSFMFSQRPTAMFLPDRINKITKTRQTGLIMRVNVCIYH